MKPIGMRWPKLTRWLLSRAMSCGHDLEINGIRTKDPVRFKGRPGYDITKKGAEEDEEEKMVTGPSSQPGDGMIPGR
ncbi:MAG: hypothetical protein D6723_16990 [Acidobacteria bacterium]|nr:MAG: hypothetical protein D6723_16990 [Acidobacteriota bacterium]